MFGSRGNKKGSKLLIVGGQWFNGIYLSGFELWRGNKRSRLRMGSRRDMCEGSQSIGGGDDGDEVK